MKIPNRKDDVQQFLESTYFLSSPSNRVVKNTSAVSADQGASLDKSSFSGNTNKVPTSWNTLVKDEMSWTSVFNDLEYAKGFLGETGDVGYKKEKVRGFVIVVFVSMRLY